MIYRILINCIGLDQFYSDPFNPTEIHNRGNRDMKTILRVSSSLLLLLLVTSSALAQSDGDWQLPRTIDGHPDLQGVWENNTITPVERPEVFGDKEILTDEDVAFLRRRIAEISAAGDDALFGEIGRAHV